MGKKFKRIGLTTILLLLTGIGLTNGVRYKISSVDEEVIEIVNVNQKVSRIPANVKSSAGSPTTPEKVNPSRPTPKEVTSLVHHYDEEEKRSHNETRSVQGQSYSMNSMAVPTANNYGRNTAPADYHPNQGNSAQTGGAPASGGVASSITFGNTPWAGSGTTSKEEDYVPYTISSISIKNGELILKGKNLNGIKSIAVNGVMFTWKDDQDKKKEVGFIAQNIEATVPELVLENEEGFLQVNYANFVAVLTEAVKEFYKKMRVDRLENENRELKKAICEINPSSKICSLSQ